MKVFHRTLLPSAALASWSRSLRFAIRGLVRAPAFSVAVFCSLAVCLGPNAAILSVLHALVLKPLPFPAPEQLVVVLNVAEKSGGQRVQSSMPQYRHFSDHADLFAGFAAVRHESATLEEDSAASRVAKDAVSASYFAVLGVQPRLGRFFNAAEEAPGQERVLVVSQTFWESHYGSDPSVLGRTVRLGGLVYTIVGVAPRSVEAIGQRTCFFQPYAPAASRFNPDLRYRGDVTVYGRLKSSVTQVAALAQLRALEANFQANTATARQRTLVDTAGYRLALEPLRAGGTAGSPAALWLLQGGALFVLLIGCMNAANLCLARLNARQNEFAIRVALGAGRGALLRQTLTESVILVGTAAAAGLALALAALRGFNSYLPTLMPSGPPVVLDSIVMGAGIVAAGAIALLLGLLPGRVISAATLRVGDARGSSTSRERRTVSSMLVTAQIALAVVLLVGAGLMIRSFANVMAVDPGFDAVRVVEGRIAVPAAYRKPADNVGLQSRVAAALRTIPGVENVAQSHDSAVAPIVRPLPFSWRAGQGGASAGEPLIHIATVSPEFFATLGIRVVTGRSFVAADDFTQQPVAVVDVGSPGTELEFAL